MFLMFVCSTGTYYTPTTGLWGRGKRKKGGEALEAVFVARSGASFCKNKEERGKEDALLVNGMCYI